jgi:hypothetical protein
VVKAFGDLAPVAEAFACAAIDPTRWNTAMEVAAKATGSFGAILLPVRGRTPSMPLSDSMHPAADRYIHEGWVHRDERYRSLPRQAGRKTFRGGQSRFAETAPVRCCAELKDTICPRHRRP